MTSTQPGTRGPVILDGYLLDGAAEYSRDVIWTPTEEVTRMYSGRARQAARNNGVGWPLNGGWYEITLRWKNLRLMIDLINELLGAPGLHELVIWERHTSIYAGNGTLDTFNLFWPPAVNDAAGLGPWNVPAAFSAAALSLATELKLGIGGQDANNTPISSTEFTVIKKDAGSFVGTPGATEAWFLDDGSQFKVGTIPDLGERLYLRSVPLLTVLKSGRVEKRQQAPDIMSTPRDVLLVEA